MPLRSRYRHIGRLKQVANALAKHGFGFIFDELGLSNYLPPGKRYLREKRHDKATRYKRIRLVLEDLGTTYIKLGQILSTRPDLLPRGLIDELTSLQDEVSPFSVAEAKAVIEEELGQRVSKLFPFFSEEPLAAASIGQVHRARTRDGLDVVVKVMRPGVREQVNTDMEILYDLAHILERRSSWGRVYPFSDMFDEFSRALREELDYTIEGTSADTLRKNLSDDPFIKIPKVYWDFTTASVLTMEYVEGVKLNDEQAVSKLSVSITDVLTRVGDSLLKQIFIDGFFHADPHPANIAVLPDGVIALMDFGLVGTLSKERRDQFTTLMIALLQEDTEGTTRAILEMSLFPENADVSSLKRDVERYQRKYIRVPVGRINLIELINDLLDLGYKYRTVFPSELTILFKALITLDGLIKGLNPEVNVTELMVPMARKLIYKRLSPEYWRRYLAKRGRKLSRLVWDIPELAVKSLRTLQSGDLEFTIRHHKLDSFLDRLSHMIDRLSISVIVLGLLVGSSLIACNHPVGILGRIPIAEVSFIIAVFIGLRLVFSILRSGR